MARSARVHATVHGMQPRAARILFFPLLTSPHVPCPSPFPLRRRDHLRPRSSSRPSSASATVFLPLPSLSSLRPPFHRQPGPVLSLIDAAAMISFAVALRRAFFLTFAHPLSSSLFIVTATASITVTLRCSFLFLVPPFPFPPTVVPSLHRPPCLPSPSVVASLSSHRRPPPPRSPCQPLLRALPFPPPPSPTTPPSTTAAFFLLPCVHGHCPSSPKPPFAGDLLFFTSDAVVVAGI